MNVRQDAAIERHDVAETRLVCLEPADHGFLAALKDADDPSFQPAFGLPLDPGHDTIAVHRFGKVRRRDKDVLALALLRLFRHDESKAAWIGLQPSDDDVHFLGNAVAVAANLEQLAARDERLDLPLEAVALFTGHAEQLRQLTRRGGVVRSFLDETKDLAAIQSGSPGGRRRWCSSHLCE